MPKKERPENEKNCFSLSVILLYLLGIKIKRRKKEVKAYKQSKKLLNNYIDLKKIIDHLQDIDKLKKVLFNDYQKFFFDLIPKPEISIFETTRRRSLLAVNCITKKKLNKTNDEIILHNYEKLSSSNLELDKLDKRILFLSNASTFLKINMIKGCRNFLI